MRKYSVQADAFFSQNINPGLREYYESNSVLCQGPIQQLITAYALSGKPVLSVGSKVAHEEVWFYRAGCPLTMCDIDEHHDIEPILRQLPAGDLAYYIGDARELPVEHCDVLYLSSFTPDELHKREIRKANMRMVVYLLQRVGLAGKQRSREAEKQDYRWPPQMDGFIPLVASLSEKAGMMILQSYASPIRADDSDYQRAASRQLSDLGFASIDLYFQEHWPSTHVFVASRLPVKPQQAISSIHGRGKNRGDRVTYRKLSG